MSWLDGDLSDRSGEVRWSATDADEQRVGATVDAHDEMELQLGRALLFAQQVASETIAEARREAARLLGEATRGSVEESADRSSEQAVLEAPSVEHADQSAPPTANANLDGAESAPADSDLVVLAELVDDVRAEAVTVGQDAVDRARADHAAMIEQLTESLELLESRVDAELDLAMRTLEVARHRAETELAAVRTQLARTANSLLLPVTVVVDTTAEPAGRGDLVVDLAAEEATPLVVEGGRWPAPITGPASPYAHYAELAQLHEEPAPGFDALAASGSTIADAAFFAKLRDALDGRDVAGNPIHATSRSTVGNGAAGLTPASTSNGDGYTGHTPGSTGSGRFLTTLRAWR